ncbi:MAG TPA: group 1 truncated hemoglobin [Polyangiaceae bacterium]|nr:group 1 truncated hemoglobin [Polyangiaceae bacterium]
MQTRFLALAALACATGLALACGTKPPPKEPPVVEAVADAAPPTEVDAAPPEPKPLIERVGGKDKLKAVLEVFGKNVQGDKKVSKIFSKSLKVDQFRDMLFEHMCEKAGGDCKYSGKPWKEAFKGLKVTAAQWETLLEDLKAAMEEKQVGETELADLVSTIAELKEEIVEAKK